MASGQLSLALQQLRRVIRRRGTGALPDTQLLERFLGDRDEAAFEVLVWRHGPMVLGVCQRVLRNPHDAEDVLQATFLTLVRKASSIGKRESLGSWLYKVAYRTALRARTRTARHSVDSVGLEELAAASCSDEVVWRELRPLLDEAVQGLPEKYRTPIVLCYLQGKTIREVAEQLACPAGTVSSRLTRGRDLLRNRLTRRGLTLSAGLLGSVLSERAVSAAVTGPLVTSTVKTASLFSAGATTRALSAHVLSLAEGASKTMFPTKCKLAALFLVVAGLLAVGADALARREAPDPPTKESPPRPGAVAPKESAEGTVVMAGQVVGPDGKPVTGARLYWPRIPKELPTSEDDFEIPQRGATDAQGRFRLELPASDVRSDLNLPALIALADGYGLGWAELPKDGPPTGLTIRLVKDLPIRGRIVNMEGKPLAGVEVGVGPVYAMPQDNLDEFLTAWKREWRTAIQGVGKPLYYPLGRPLALPKTDKDGRFELHGIGAERVAVVSFKGAGVAQGMAHVLCRAGIDPAAYNRAAQDNVPPEIRIPGQTPLLYGPTFEFVAATTRIVEGTVRAPDGKPVAGIRVWSGTGYDSTVNAVSDSSGHYRLAGLPKQKEYMVIAEPRANDPWPRWAARLPDAEGLRPLQQDVEFVRGVVVTGRVIDRATGKAVRSGLRYAPLADNAFFGTKPGYDSYRCERLTTMSEADGRFRILVIPGTGVLMVQIDSREVKVDGVPINPYTQAVVDPADGERLKVTKNGRNRTFQAAGTSLEFLDNLNACKVLDLAEGSGPVTCDLYVERGQTITVNIVDPDGKPLAGTTAAGLTATWPLVVPLKKASCTVYALDSATPRALFFFHPGRKLGAMLKVRGDEQEPPTVKLRPTGSVTGRILDLDGQPVAGARVSAGFADDTLSELYRRLEERQEPFQTDKDGRFRLDGILGDAKFGLGVFKENKFLVGEPRIGQREVGPGKTLELGEVRTRPQ